MRNIFDQYSQPENRVTHALMTALNEDRKLLDSFLTDIARHIPPKNGDSLHITEQSYPGSAASDGIDENEIERRGIPDAWITAGEDWCLVIENKVLSTPSDDQLRRHRGIARRLGFTMPKLLLLTVRPPGKNLPDDIEVVPWSAIYTWLQGQTVWSKWAQRLTDYLEVMEARMIDREQMESGILTAFNGFRFGEDNSFNDLEAKRVLRLAMAELRQRTDLPAEIGVDPALPGRGAIKKAWDFLAFARDADGQNFTAYPHLTLGIGPDDVAAMVTLPNSAREAWRCLSNLGEDGFKNAVNEVLEKMRPLLSQCPGMEPRLRIYQRHWPKRSVPPQTDARLDIDLRTYGNKDGDKIKFQSEWVEAVFTILKSKKSNIEMQVGAVFPYRTCKAIQEPKALDFVAVTWIACQRYISALGVL